jgi:hypothetical protein
MEGYFKRIFQYGGKSRDHVGECVALAFLDLPYFVFCTLFGLGDCRDGDDEIFANVGLVAPWVRGY